MRRLVNPVPSLVVASLLATLGASGCKGVDERDFVVDYELRYCRAVRRCSSDEMLSEINIQECLEWMRLQDYPEPPDCRYDRELAEQCLEELPTTGCTDLDPTFPESCGQVYGGCRYPRLPREGEAENR
jgi:hypothetical protein